MKRSLRQPPSARRSGLVLLCLVLLWLIVDASTALSQPEGECLDDLDALEAVIDTERARRWADVDAICEAEHRRWLTERHTYDVPTRSWVDEAMAVQSSRWATARATLGRDCLGALGIISDVAHALPALPQDAHSDFAAASRAAFVCVPGPVPTDVPVPELGDEILEMAGTSGGDHDANRFGMPCIGHVPEEPSHVFDVTRDQRVSLVAMANETGNLSLVLTGPGGTFCDDDTYGLNPALSERLMPGRYAVFVGETTGAGRSTGYRLFVAAQALPSLQTGTTPTVASIGWPPEGGSVRHTGRSEGFFNAALLGPSCVGRINERPDFGLDLNDHTRVSIEVTPDGRDDLTLAVVGRDAVVCNDVRLEHDPAGHDPAISTFLPAGHYDVWVGRQGDRAVSFNARLSADDLFGVEPGVLTPLFATGSLGESVTSLWLAGVVSGEEEASARFGPYCDGYIAYQPSHTLYLDAAADVWLEASPGSASVPGHSGTDYDTGDLTLIVTGPSGTFCSNDGRGRDPLITQRLDAGTYDVYVGEAELTPVGTAYGLRASLSEPLRGLERPGRLATLSVTGPGADTWQSWGRTFGQQPASAVVAPSCSGELPRRPSVELTLSNDARLTVSAGSGSLGAPVLAIVGPSGSFCAADGDVHGVTIDEQLSAGHYEIYVGEALGTLLGTPFALAIEARPASGMPSDGPAPEPISPAAPLELTLDATFGMGGAPGVSGGSSPGRLFGASCVGHLPSEPQLVAHVTEPGTYRFAVLAAGDTTLIIDGPGGPFCDDDTTDFNPVVEGWLEAGDYSVYVGSYSSGLRHDYSMFISRQQPMP